MAVWFESDVRRFACSSRLIVRVALVELSSIAAGMCRGLIQTYQSSK